MQLDPVCGKRVAESRNKNSVEYADQTYYFCSPGCLERFDAQPDLFTAGPGEGNLADRDRGVLPGHGAQMPGPNPQAKLEQASSDAGPG